MVRIRLVPENELSPELRRIKNEAEAHRLNPAIFQAAGNLPETFEAFWSFYSPLKLRGLLESRLKELVRLKIANLNDCAT